jgi:GNAT superfamily N-acetyltransferase
MIDPIVRRAGSGDAAAVRDLERSARSAVVETRGGARWLDEHPEIGDGWSSEIGAGHGAVFVATIPVAHAEVPVGYLVARIRDDPMRIVHVDQVFVEPEARELGFGDALLAAAIDWGRAEGAEIVEGHALPGDRNIKNLYERAGITARLITVSRRL